MSMTNFLPWRRQRRVRCLRFWGVLFVATWLLILMGVFSLRMNPLVLTRALHIQLAGMQSVQQVLVSRTRSGTETPTPVPAKHIASNGIAESVEEVGAHGDGCHIEPSLVVNKPKKRQAITRLSLFFGTSGDARL